MKTDTYYVEPVGSDTNKVISDRLGIGAEEAMHEAMKVKGGGSANVYQCSEQMVRELYRSKGSLNLAFGVYTLANGEFLVPANVTHLLPPPRRRRRLIGRTVPKRQNALA